MHQPHNVRQTFFMLLVVGVTIAFFGMIKSFLLAAFWAIILAITFQRIYRIIRLRLKGRSDAAAVLTLLAIISLVVVPVSLILLSLVNEGRLVAERIGSGEWQVASVLDYLEGQSPRIEGWLREVGLTMEKVREDLSSFASRAASAIADQAFTYTQNLIALMAQFFLMLYMLYFFLRDGRDIVRSVMNAIPLGNHREQILINRFTSVVRATLKGTVIVAIVQGSIGGVLFAILGIEGALFWGVLMTLFAFLPVGGSAIVWAPAAIIMLIQGNYVKGIVILIVGSLIIGLIDNLLRPLLVGRDTKMPDYLILLSTLGGIAWFGLSGFVLGPVIAALFLTCWKMAGEMYGGREK